MDTAWVGVVASLGGVALGFVGQSLWAVQQRSSQKEDRDRAHALQRESDLRPVRLAKYEQFKQVSSAALLAFTTRALAEAEAEDVSDEDTPENVEALTRVNEALVAATQAFGDLMGATSDIDAIGGERVRNAASAVTGWLTEAFVRRQAEGWEDVLTVFSPLQHEWAAAMRAELTGG